MVRNRDWVMCGGKNRSNICFYVREKHSMHICLLHCFHIATRGFTSIIETQPLQFKTSISINRWETVALQLKWGGWKMMYHTNTVGISPSLYLYTHTYIHIYGTSSNCSRSSTPYLVVGSSMNASTWEGRAGYYHNSTTRSDGPDRVFILFPPVRQ